jgi:hypothetical protein
MSEPRLKRAQPFDRQARLSNEFEHLALGASDALRFLGDLWRDLRWNRQQAIDVSMQEIAGIHAEPCHCHR